jgi:hypothetical protein
MAAWDNDPIIRPASTQPQATAGSWNDDGAEVTQSAPASVATKGPAPWSNDPIITPADQRNQNQQIQPTQTPTPQKPDKSWYSNPFSDTKDQVGAGTAAIRGVGNGITLGFQDEILAGLDAAVQPLIPIPENGSSAETWRQRFDENVANQRAQLKTGQDQHPYVSTAGDLAGGVGLALATGGTSLGASTAAAAARQTTGRAIATGAATGAAYGGAYGFGSAEGGVGDRIPGALQGAALGGIVGGVVPAAIGSVKAVSNAITSPEVRAQAQLGRALERDNLTPEQFRAQYDELAAQQPGSAIPADAGGENVRGLVERLATAPGQARTTITDTLTGRQSAQGDRIADNARSLSGVNRSADAAIDDTIARRAQESAPLYAAAHAEEVPWTPQLQALMKRPAMQAAYRDAERRAANQGRAFDGQFMDIAADGSVTPRAVPRTGDLDVIKQNLDGQIEGLLGSGAKSEARDIIGIRNELLGIMDASAPTYAKARAVFAGHSQYRDAIDHGSNIFKMNISPERWASDFARLNPSEQEAARIGAVSTIISRIGNDSAGMPDITKYLRSPNGRAKVAAILPDDAARAAWENALNHEIGVSKLTGRALGNSATARRQAELDEANGVIGDLVAAGFSGASPAAGLMHTLMRAIPRKIGAKINERSNRLLANALTSKDGLDALNGVLPRAVIGREAPAIAGVAAGQYGSAAAERRNVPAQRIAARQRQAIQAATSGYYQTMGAANTALFDAGIRDRYEAYKVPGSGAWAVRQKAVELPATVVTPRR